MNIHILVPFYRKYLYKTLLHYYNNLGIIFHPICDHVDIEPFKDNILEWVKPFLCPPLKNGEPCYTKFNYFLENNDIIDNDYYGFAGDDDMFEEGLVDELQKSEAEIIFISSYRGDTVPNDGGAPHPAEILLQRNIHDVCRGRIGLGMFFVKGYILRPLRFVTDNGWGDGIFAENLCDKGTLEFKPDVFLFFNYFQPGRHTDKNKLLKPTWKLPQIIS